MSAYACNPEGVKLLNAMSTSLVNALDEIGNSTTNVRSVAEDNSGYLGPHVQSFFNALTDIEATLKKASIPAKEVSNKLINVANKYQDVIDNDPFV